MHCRREYWIFSSHPSIGGLLIFISTTTSTSRSWPRPPEWTSHALAIRPGPLIGSARAMVLRSAGTGTSANPAVYCVCCEGSVESIHRTALVIRSSLENEGIPQYCLIADQLKVSRLYLRS